MEEKLISTVHTFVGKRSNTLRSWWRRGRDDHLDAAGWLPAGYRPLLSSRQNLPRPSWYVTDSRARSATGKDGHGQTSSDRRPKLRRKRGRGGGRVETWVGMDGGGLRGEEAAGE